MRLLGISCFLLSSTFAASCMAAAPIDSKVKEFSDSLLGDCVLASNIFQQEAKLTEGVATSPELRRIDFLLRDEMMRRLSKAENKQEFSGNIYTSEYAKTMLGDLTGLDLDALAKSQWNSCQELNDALVTRLQRELENGDD